jgi:hypothetical protein
VSRALPNSPFTHILHTFLHILYIFSHIYNIFSHLSLSHLLIFLIMFLLQIQKVRNKHSNHKPNQNPFHFCFSFLLSSSILIHFQISNAPLTNPAVAKKYQIYKRKVFISIFHLSFSFQISKWFQEQQEKRIFVSTFYSSSYNSAVSTQFSKLPLASEASVSYASQNKSDTHTIYAILRIAG